MRRRAYLEIVAGAAVGLAGCMNSRGPTPGTSEGTPSVGTCPDLLAADRTACPGNENGPLAVVRSSPSVSADSWRLRIGVTNQSSEPYGCDPFAWSLFKQAGGGWSSVAPDVPTEPRVELAPGDSYAWQLCSPAADVDGVDRRIVLDLGTGRYALAVPFRGPDLVAVVAPFAVRA